MIRTSSQTAYGLGYLASLHRPDRTRDTDYTAQARADFAWYAQLTPAQLDGLLKGHICQRSRTSMLRPRIMEMWRERLDLTQREIADELGCSFDYVNKVIRGRK